jgi:hypothetical protein
MNLLQFLIMGGTLLILATLLWVGQKADRIGAAAFVGVMIGTQLLYPLEIANVRWGVALLSLTFLVVLMGLVVASRRWWIIAAAGFQLAAVSTYAIALAQPDLLIWTGVSLRLVMWILQMFACGFGIAEALSQRNLIHSDARPNAPYFPTGYNR